MPGPKRMRSSFLCLEDLALSLDPVAIVSMAMTYKKKFLFAYAFTDLAFPSNSIQID